MKERPILFSAPMVRAILDGRKSQTRRIAKPIKHPDWGNEYSPGALVTEKESNDVIDRACPYGAKGDRLWVRETFQPLFADGIENYSEVNWKTGKGYQISYPATDGVQEFMDSDDNIRDACKPSIHMPRWASRILLEITNIRVERLNDISEEDAIAEGFASITKDDGRTVKYGIPDRDGYPGNDDIGWNWCDWNVSPVLAYKRLWESINGKSSWNINPFVWAIEFKRIDVNENSK